MDKTYFDGVLDCIQALIVKQNENAIVQIIETLGISRCTLLNVYSEESNEIQLLDSAISKEASQFYWEFEL